MRIFGELVQIRRDQAATPAAPPANPGQLYAAQLQTLTEMGFFDADANLRALVATGGNVQAAVERLLG